MWIKWIYSQYLHVLFPSAEKNTGKTGECVVSAGTRSGAHKKSFSKIYFILCVGKFNTLNLTLRLFFLIMDFFKNNNFALFCFSLFVAWYR